MRNRVDIVGCELTTKTVRKKQRDRVRVSIIEIAEVRYSTIYTRWVLLGVEWMTQYPNVSIFYIEPLTQTLCGLVVEKVRSLFMDL